MPKREYDIDGRQFHVEKGEAGWIGWFVDEPSNVYCDQLKMDVLNQVGYRPAHPGGLVVSFGPKPREYGPPRTMQDAYDKFRRRLQAGHFPRFRLDKPLSKFVILARDRCQCIYCGQEPEKSADAQIDHVVPLSAGGPSTAGNVAVACRECNLSKGGSRLPNEADILREIRDRNRNAGIDDQHALDVVDPT